MIDQEDYTVQGSTAWKNKRRECITATDVSKIISVNPYCTALKLWNQKLGLEPEQQENEAMRLGSALETPARELFIKETGINFTPVVKFHPVDTWKMASLDGLSDCGKYGVEIKCSKSLYEKTKCGFIDEIYRCQVQWQAYIVNIPMVYFMAYWDGDYAVLEIKRDDDFLNEIMPKIHEFRNQLLNFTPPDACDRDYIKRDSRELQFHLEVWKQTKAEMKLLEAKDELLRDTIIKMCDGISSECNGVRIAKTTRRGNIQYDKIEALKEIDLEVYRSKPTTSYRFTEIKGQDE